MDQDANSATEEQQAVEQQAESEQVNVSEGAVDTGEEAQSAESEASPEASPEEQVEAEAKPEPEPEKPNESVVVLVKPRVNNDRSLVQLQTEKVPEQLDEEEQEQEEEEGEGDGDAEKVEPAIEYEKIQAGTAVTEILYRIKAAGLKIDEKRTLILSKVQAREFYRGVPGTTEQTINYLCSGALLALRVSGPGAVEVMNNLAGPEDPREAKAARAEEQDDRKKSLRALFGLSRLENAVHCSASVYDSLWESGVTFPRSHRMEQSVLLIGPGQEQLTAVSALLMDNDLVVVGQQTTRFENEDAASEFFEGLPDTKSRALAHAAGPNLVICVEGDAAVSRLKLIAGINSPTGINTTRKVPILISNAIRNPLYVSHSAERAAADVARFFKAPMAMQRTLAIIKPDAADRADAIVAHIIGNGFTIVAQQRVQLSYERAEQFYAEHRGKFFFHKLCQFMSSGPCYLLVLAKAGAIKHWRLLCGPTDSRAAKLDKPDSLRAKYGTDNTANAVHGSETVGSAEREISFFFPGETRGDKDGGYSHLRADEAKKFMKTAPSAVDSARSLHSVLVEGLTELCRTKPDDTTAIRALGRWLLANNPNAPHAANNRVGGGGGTEAAAARPGTGEKSFLPKPVNNGAVIPLVDAPPLNVVFLIGGPGSGRQAQARSIVRDFGYVHINTGDLLRAEIDAQTAVGKEAQAVIDAGDLVESDVILKLIRNKMRKAGGSKFLIDGFPRDVDQAFTFEQQVGQVHTVLYLERSRQNMIATIMDEEDAPEEEDLTEKAARRVEVFHSRTTAVIEFYDKLGKVAKVRTKGLSSDQIYSQIHEALCPNVVFVAGGANGQRAAVANHVSQIYHGWVALSVEQLMRDEIASGSQLGQEINDLIGEDRPIPTQMQVGMLDRAMDESPHDRFIVHDFPTSLEEALAFEQVVGGPRFFLDLSNGDGGDGGERTEEVLQFYRALGYVRQVDSKGGLREALRTVGEHFEPDVRFVLGPPGAGKTQQCDLAREQGFTVLSTQDILFAEIQRGSDEGRRIHHMVEINQIIPISTHLKLIRNIIAAAGPKKKFLIDGFPKALDQARAFEETVAKVSEIVFLKVDDITSRRRALESAHGNRTEYQVAKQLARFNSQTELVINHYAKLGLCRTVDASSRLEDTEAQMRQALSPDVVFVVGPSARARKNVCEKLQKDFGFLRVSPAELLQCELRRPTPTGTMVASLIRKKHIIPVDVTVQLIQQAIEASGSRRIVIDNFPIAPDQVLAFETKVGAPSFVLYLDSGGNASGVKQHLTASNPELSAQKIDELVNSFETVTRPVIEKYRSAGKVRTVNATLSDEDMYREAGRYFKPVLVPLVGSKYSQKDLLTTILGRKYGFARLDVPGLQNAEAQTQSKDGAIIARCRAQNRTVPTDVTLRLVRKAILHLGNNRFLIDGFPQQVSAGYPMAHDQVFAIEDTIAPLAFGLHCSASVSTQRELARTTADVEEEADRFSREVQPVIDFLSASGHTPVLRVDTTNASASSWEPVTDQIACFPPAMIDILEGRSGD
jgi:adenylate kinase family enzyme/nucleoside diphosphate kinase